mgnify:CR=1 FL=1
MRVVECVFARGGAVDFTDEIGEQAVEINGLGRRLNGLRPIRRPLRVDYVETVIPAICSD